MSAPHYAPHLDSCWDRGDDYDLESFLRMRQILPLDELPPHLAPTILNPRPAPMVYGWSLTTAMVNLFKEKAKEAQTLALLGASTLKESPPLSHHGDNADELTILNSGANIVLEELGVQLPLQRVITTAQFYDEISFELLAVHSNHVLEEPPHPDVIAKIATRFGIDMKNDPPKWYVHEWFS